MAMALCMAVMQLSACGSIDGQKEAVNGGRAETGADRNAAEVLDTEEKTGDRTTATGSSEPTPTAAPAQASASPATVSPEAVSTAAPTTAPTEAPTPAPRDMRDELAADMEQTIRELYEQRLILKEAVRTIVARRIENTSFLTVNPREQFSVTEVLIDEVTGNPIVSEGVKEFFRAAAEGKSLQDMCRAALESGAAQIPDYLTGQVESSLQDAVTSLIGVDIFSPTNLISQWANPDQEPTVLLQGIVQEQKQDVSALVLFLQQEDISTADIYKVAQMVYATELRDQEISVARGGIREYSGAAETLRGLAEQYADTEALLSAYAQLELPKSVPELNEADRRRISEEQAKASVLLEKYNSLCSLPIGNVAANYDVEGFRETQKMTSQSGLLGNLLLGDLIGGAFAESGQVVQDQIQENRRALCEMLTDFMEEGYAEVAEAQGKFAEQYRVLSHAAQADGNELYLAALYLETQDWETQTEDAAKAYLTALSRYLSDIDSAAILYNCILTSQQADYLFDLQLEIDAISQIMRDFEWYAYGYSNDELLERWSSLVDCYIKSVTYILERGGALTGNTPGFCSNGTGKLGGLDYKVYTKEFTAQSRPIMIQGGGRSYYYDTDGNLICVDASYERITGRHFYLLSYLSYSTGSTLQTTWGSDPESPEMQKMNQQLQKAQELYSHFTAAQ